jgi:hypothetical protein
MPVNKVNLAPANTPHEGEFTAIGDFRCLVCERIFYRPTYQWITGQVSGQFCTDECRYAWGTAWHMGVIPKGKGGK